MDSKNSKLIDKQDKQTIIKDTQLNQEKIKFTLKLSLQPKKERKILEKTKN